MNIKDKLDRLSRTKPTTTSVADDSKKQTIAELRQRVEAITNKDTPATPVSGTVEGRALSRPLSAQSTPAANTRRRVVTPIGNAISGTEQTNAHGSFFLVEELFASSQMHGKFAIREFVDICTQALSLLANDKRINKYKNTDALFFDLETTGLAGGTGTFPFMIGIGWFDGDNFILKQLFSRDHSEEKASLTYLLEAAADKEFLISFNGKSYDMTLLSARLILNRLANPLLELPHLDLLHSCRRVLGHRLDSCSLTSVEANILKHYRDGDIPGFEIPQRYFDWLRMRDPTLVVDIFYHNRLDIVSMAGIALHLSNMLNEGDCLFTRDALHMTKLKIERSDSFETESIEKLVQLAGASDTSIAVDAMTTLATIYKKNGQMEEAATLWQKIIQAKPQEISPVEELAKYYEHEVRDYYKARSIIETVTNSTGFIPRKERESLNHRLTRLKEKIANKSNKPSRNIAHKEDTHC